MTRSEERAARIMAELRVEQITELQNHTGGDVEAKRSGFGIGELGRISEGTIADAPAITVTHTGGSRVRCACGHTVWANLVMSTSCGTSCPDCYDRMSE